MEINSAARDDGKRIILILAVLVLLFASARSSAQMNGMGGDAVETLAQGTINWTSGDVFATGIGAPPPHAVNPAQARAMAERAAMVVALRNLLEIVKGIQVDSETVIENFAVRSDVIRTRISGIVRGAMPVKKQYLSDGSIEITVSLKMKGALLDAVVPDTFGGGVGTPVPLHPAPISSNRPPDAKQIPPPSPSTGKPLPPATSGSRPDAPKPAPPKEPEKMPEPAPVPPAPSPSAVEPSSVQFKGGKATGIVIDGRGLGLRPALLPKIVDPQGQEIYVGQVVTRTNAVEQGVAGYARDVNAAANNFRVTDNPAVIKGIKATGAARTDVMLAPADAKKLRDLSRDANFLQYCRVIIVY